MTESKTPAPITHCYGIACEKHSTCKAYHAVNGAVNVTPVGTCDIERKTWPAYVAVFKKE